MKHLSILGSTGSIGTQALDVAAAHPEEFVVEALAARRSGTKLEEQARRFRPKLVALQDEEEAAQLKKRLADTAIRVEAGEEGVLACAALEDCDTVLNALVGIAGLRPTVAALEAGHTLALANKESLVCAGGLVMELARQKGRPILPVDSEHSAIFQALGGRPLEEVRRLVLTASGGPFFGRQREELACVTAQDALRHPNWSMGAKITIDSATMMNKGFEVIEALWLFGVAPEQVEVVVHRESILHSAVEFTDGCVMAQMSPPDMRLPIQYALTYPRRMEGHWPRLDLAKAGQLTFCPPDRENFPSLPLCEQAGKQGGDRGCVINAANEVAVELFLQGKIGYTEIYELARQAVEQTPYVQAPTSEQIFAIDAAVRQQTRQAAVGC